MSYKAAVLALLLLCSCKSPEGDIGPWPGMPFVHGTHPMPTPDDPGKSVEVFYDLPDCAGQGYVAGYGGEFAYESIRIGASCFEESGRGYGFVVGP